MALITCPECGKQFSSQAAACPECALPRERIRFCGECGTPVLDEATSCAECGAPRKGGSEPLTKAGATSADASVPPPKRGGSATLEVKTITVSGLTKAQREAELAKIRTRFERRGWLFRDYRDGVLSGKADFELPPNEAKRLRRRNWIIGLGTVGVLSLCCLLPFASENPSETGSVGRGGKVRLPIGLTYDQVMQYLDRSFIMEYSAVADGSDRYLGSTMDSLAMLEIIGTKSNISSTFLMIGTPNDRPDLVARNAGMLARFLQNTFPEWPDVSDWGSAALERIASGPRRTDQLIRGDRLVKMEFTPELGMVMITVRHKSSS